MPKQDLEEYLQLVNELNHKEFERRRKEARKLWWKEHWITLSAVLISLGSLITSVIALLK